ncbi:DUF4245 domain-containing protein [Actinomadura rudentiformis]|uniref:DUF4245 domain-containing protein n=1 Tax=Actinomadura rudentiformis TaxID=359158 RepID=A0A6H9YSD5_9ACTN|nr:DUF4245 domain-containing protein [Actinomadura rudentiformis]
MVDPEKVTDKTPSPSPEDTPPPAEQEGKAAGEPPAAAAGGRPTVEVAPGVYKRLTTGLGGFTLAMAACLVLVGVIYLITPRSDKEVLPTVDYSGQQWAMATDAPYTVWAPVGLPPTWRPTSSRINGLNGKGPVAWHLGFMTPGRHYAALEQSNEKASQYVHRMTNNKKPNGSMQVNGITWTTYYRKDKKANSLARTLPDGVSLVVTGTAPYEELAVLAAALKPQPKQGTKLPAGSTPAS